MKRFLALAIAAVAQAGVPTMAVAWNGDLRSSRHIVVHWRHHAPRTIAREALAPQSAGAPTAAAWAPLFGAFTVPFAHPPPPLRWPNIAPYPPGQGDTDGLSTDIDDCNKGCIGGNPD